MLASKPNTLSYCEATTDGRLCPLNDPQSADLESVFQIGARIEDRYSLQSSLGRGGMGHVFLAKDHRLNRLVAMKVVANRSEESQGRLQDALAQEAKLGALLNHPGIAAVYDFGVHAGRYFTIFEYVEGLTLRDVLQRRTKLPLDECRMVVGALARALDFAHSKGVIHRDLKPENICIANNGQLKILDLGVARHLRQDLDARSFTGTPAYAAPEQAACGPTDGRTDQYALALVAYELLSARRVFEHDDPVTLLMMHQEQAPESLRLHCPIIPGPAEVAIMRALEKDPNKRFATCQEFADAFGCNRSSEHGSASAIRVPTEDRVAVYISHTSDDSLIAKQLAGLLEQEGYSTWYYQRNALPGISFLTQTAEAIHRSGASLLLISRASLRSSEFAQEIQEAHQVNCPFLPLLVDLSSEEFRSHQRDWRPMLGSAAVIELDRSRMTDTARRLASALELLGVERNRERIAPAGEPRSEISGQAWATDANQIDIHDLERIVFTNDIIDDFLHQRHKCFLSATKGLGKTLLLTYKRLLLTTSHRAQSAEQSLCLVPQGRPFLDFMSEMKSLSKKYEKPLSELNTTKRIWSAALRVAALSHHPALIEADEAFELEPFPKRVQRWLKGSKIEPTVVFKELTNLPIGAINRLIDNTENFLDQKLRMIHSGTYFFIDKVDQAVRRLSRAAWINIQAGLIEAAWDLMNANSHVKVLATIRQEAFTNYASDIKSNLYGATTILRYTEQELLDLMNNLARCYEGSNGFKDFIGLNVIKQQHQPLLEDSFQFVRRHTFGRPRDLVAIASELSANRSSLNENKFCELVGSSSATALVSNIFEEMHVFLDCLHAKETRLRFLAAIGCNILSREDAVNISAEFNGLPAGSIQHFGEESPEIFHPFRDLYQTGLLGVLVREPESGTTFQKFRQPDDIVSDGGTDLPVSSFYFIHPALNRLISRYRGSDAYHVFQQVLVGQNAVWEPYDTIICSIEKYVVGMENRQLCDALHQLLRQARGVLKSARQGSLRMMLDSSSHWKALQQRLENENHDDVLLWIEQLAEGEY